MSKRKIEVHLDDQEIAKRQKFSQTETRISLQVISKESSNRKIKKKEVIYDKTIKQEIQVDLETNFKFCKHWSFSVSTESKENNSLNQKEMKESNRELTDGGKAALLPGLCVKAEIKNDS